MIRKILENEYKTSMWSGGKTTEICIFPDDESYANRKFLWRLSSATIDIEKSEFTKLSDYNRYIASLDNEIFLNEKRLAPLELFYFDGADDKTSFGKCRDFNLMLRKNQCFVDVILLSSDDLFDFSKSVLILFCINGDCTVLVNNKLIELKKFESLIVDENARISIKSNNSFDLFKIEIIYK